MKINIGLSVLRRNVINNNIELLLHLMILILTFMITLKLYHMNIKITVLCSLCSIYYIRF